ncbi:putative signal transducing protein [Salegentibacter chungangensis]|uniref:DUF2007 domain-containing protein n=1 Tax=Salegentibacter chungangensis TaxID=1335724 RepID=A0ABW3NPX0_9FLAO
MDYITVFTTTDHSEVSIIKGLFDQENVHYKILDENRELDTGMSEVRIQVSEEDRVKAREILHEGGLLGGSRKAVTAWHSRRKPVKKWMFVFLAALIVVLVALLVMWFMSAE